MNFEVLHPADQICILMERIYDMEMTSLTGGNISMMDEEGVMWVTPTSIDKKSLTREDIVKVLPDGTIVGKHKPTSEYYIHRNILVKRPDIKAVIHAHAPATVTLSVLNEIPTTKLYPAAYAVAGEPQMTPYALPGSMKLVDRVMEAFDAGFDTAILEKHSAFVGSQKSLLDAYWKFEALDFASRVQINSYTVGVPKELSHTLLEKYMQHEVSIEAVSSVGGHTERELEARRVMTSIIQRAYKKKLFSSRGGVFSARIDENSFLIVKEGVDNGAIALEDFAVVREGKYKTGEIPEKTVLLHKAIYDAQPEVNAVIIAQPMYSMGFVVTDAVYDTTLYPESYGVLCLGNRYPFSTIMEHQEMIAQNLDLAHPLAIVENYGIILTGATPILAFDKLEVCESSAQSIHECKRMGREPIMMTMEQIKEMEAN
ncbi:MAG: class II aldolase/adducin family protein [Lachnospiraceae bacterium]